MRNPTAIPHEEEQDPDDLRGADRDVAGGDRPEALLGVEAVGLDVERVVQEVGAARREAEGDERDRGVEDGVALAEHTGGGGCGDDEHVLDPLLRTSLVDEAADEGTWGLHRRKVFGARRKPGPAGSRRHRPCEDGFLPGETDPPMLLPAPPELGSCRRARASAYAEPPARSRDSATAHPKMPFAMVDASASTRSSNTSARAPCDHRVVGCRERGELGEMTGEPEVTGLGQRDRARGEPWRATGELGELARRARLRAPA